MQLFSYDSDCNPRVLCVYNTSAISEEILFIPEGKAESCFVHELLNMPLKGGSSFNLENLIILIGKIDKRLKV